MKSKSGDTDSISPSWRIVSEYRDGTGREIHAINFRQQDILYELNYMPAANHLWFYRRDREDSESTRMFCHTMEVAQQIVDMLKNARRI